MHSFSAQNLQRAEVAASVPHLALDLNAAGGREGVIGQQRARRLAHLDAACTTEIRARDCVIMMPFIAAGQLLMKLTTRHAVEPLSRRCLHSQWRQVLSMRDAVFMVSPAGMQLQGLFIPVKWEAKGW